MNPHDFQLKYIQRLIIFLTISGILNIALISLFFYWMVKDHHPSPYFEQKPAQLQEQQPPLAIESGNVELIHYFRSLPIDQLVMKLSNQQLIENGYAQRDIALACLVAFHHFDLSRALVGQMQPEQQRSIVYGRLKNGKPASLIVYPGLNEQQFQSIINFAETERWPLTSKGLYLKLKKQGVSSDQSLIDAFMMTPEFLAIELLFNRAEVSIGTNEILQMLLEGNWMLVSSFTEQQKLVQDLSSAKRQHFLLEYVGQGSKTAAYLLLKMDGEFALKKLDDHQVIKLLELLQIKTAESEKYAISLLTSPRSDLVWKKASAKLYEYAGEMVPEKNVHHTAMNRFVPGQVMIEMPLEKPIQQNIVSKVAPSNKPKPSKKNVSAVLAAKPPLTIKPSPQSNKKDRLYIVQEGDTLWKISRRFNVDVILLREYNKLKNDALKPGTPIKIPMSST